MATIPLEDLTKALTVNDVKAAIYRVLELTGVSTTVWKPGAVVRTIISGAAVVLAALSTLAALLARSGFVSLSSGLWKALAALYIFGVVKQEATFAAGEALLSNSSGFLYALSPGDLTVKSTVSGKSYVNTSSVTLNPLDVDVPCDFAAVESGSDSTAFVGEVDALVTTLFGVTVTNPTAWIGLDEESDDALQAKCDEKLGALSPNGPPDAYAHFARNAKRLDGTPIGVTRVRVMPDGDLGVDVYCATASGVVVGNQDDPTTDLGAVHDAIQKNVVPIPITERTHSATAHPIAVSYSVWLYNTRAFTPAQIADGIARSLAALISSAVAAPIGGNVVPPAAGTIDDDLIKAAIISATSADGIPLGIFRCDLTLPAAPVTLTSNECPTLGAVTALSIVQIAPPQGTF